MVIKAVILIIKGQRVFLSSINNRVETNMVETESENEDAQNLIAELLANSPGSNMIQAISEG